MTTLPPLPAENEDPWYAKRNAFDLAVKAEIEGLSTAYTPARRKITVMGLGDSQTANGGNNLLNPSTSTEGDCYYGDVSWHLFAHILSGAKFEHIGNSAAGGYTIQQIRDILLPAVLRIRPAFCVVLAGENNKGTLAPADLTALANIYDQLAAAGILAILCTTPPTTTTLAQYTLDAWVRNQSRIRNLPLADLNASLVNPATGLWKAGTNADAYHQNAAGAMLMGAELARVMAPLLTAGNADLASDEISTGNLTPKPLFLTDTGGVPPFPTTGWGALSTFAPGCFSFTAAETPAEGRYFNGHRIGGVDNQYKTDDWTLGAGHVLRVAFGIKATVPAGGSIEVLINPPPDWVFTPFRALFTQSITGTLAFQTTIRSGEATYVGFKTWLKVTGADGTILGIKRFTARDLTALGIGLLN